MSTQREVLQQALEALENVRRFLYGLDDDITTLRAALQEHLRGAQSGEPLANRLANHPRTLGSPMSDQGLDDILSEHVTVTDPNLHGAIYMAMRDLEAAHGIVERPCTCHPDDSPPTPQQEVQEPVAWGAFYFGGRRNGKLYSHCDTQAQIEAYIADRHQSDDSNTFRAAPLYTAPPQRHPHRTVTYVCPVCAASLEKQE